MEKQEIKSIESMMEKIGGVSYGSLTYRNQYGEKAKYLLNFGIRHRVSLEKDLIDLRTLKRALYPEMSKHFDAQTIGLAFLKEKQSIISSLSGTNVHSQAQKDAYVWINGGMKLGITSRELYLFAYVERKDVIEAGTYPKVNSKPLTLARKMIGKNLRKGKYRQFTVTESQLQNLKTGGEILEFGEV